MLPISDSDAPGRRFPIVNWLLIGINVLVFLYELTLGTNGIDQFSMNWGLIPSNFLNAIAHPGAPGAGHAFLTLITSQFIHGGWLHIIGNMLFLYVFGDDIEDLLGSAMYLLFYLFCGVVAGLTQVFILSRFTGGLDIPNIGASGAIAGVLGAYFVVYRNRRVTVLGMGGVGAGGGSIPSGIMIGWWFIQQLFYGIAALTPQTGQSAGIAFWAHVGGFIAGALLMLLFAQRVRRTTNVSGMYPA